MDVFRVTRSTRTCRLSSKHHPRSQVINHFRSFFQLYIFFDLQAASILNVKQQALTPGVFIPANLFVALGKAPLKGAMGFIWADSTQGRRWLLHHAGIGDPFFT